jgi:uncharacterized membrane protein
VHRRRGRRLTEPLDARLLHRNRALAFGSAILAATVVAIAAPAWLRGSLRVVAAYDAAALLLLANYWLIGIKGEAKETYRRAALTDPGKNVVLWVVIISCLAGLGSAITVLGHGPNVPAADRNLALALGLAAVVLGWLVIHSTFIFRYAHLYYVDEGGSMRRGMLFPGESDPDDYDFAYFSFVLGMTFQVSDVQIVDSGVRRLATVHGLIAFAYNTAILALVINLASNLLNPH